MCKNKKPIIIDAVFWKFGNRPVVKPKKDVANIAINVIIWSSFIFCMVFMQSIIRQLLWS